MLAESEKSFARLPLFDPEAGLVVRRPERSAPGYWVGAPTAIYDGARERFYLVYRRRRPREDVLDRSYEITIAESKDGIEFDDVWKMRKSELSSASIEKCSLLRGHDDRYRLYVSYVDPVDSRWRIDVLESDSPDSFDTARRSEVLTAASASRAHDLPVEGVKDPAVYLVGRVYYMFVSFAEGIAPSHGARRELHRTSDVYNTGLLTAPTALATSTDGVRFRWRGRVLPVGAKGAWDAYQSRLGSIVRRGGIWYGFYDGSRSHEENYEERAGMAQSLDLIGWEKTSEDGPVFAARSGSGSVRYIEVLRLDGDLHYYYEMATADGSHELRAAVVPISAE